MNRGVKDLSGQRFGMWTVIENSAFHEEKRYYWKCKCDCGIIRKVMTASLLNGMSKGCGCSHNLKYHLTAKEACENALYSRLLDRCKRKHYSLGLSKEEYINLTKQPCHYCGTENSNSTRSQGGIPISYNGVDRVDNNVGYIKENCVPCCSTCNKAKTTMTEKEFKDWICRITVWSWFNGR